MWGAPLAYPIISLRRAQSRCTLVPRAPRRPYSAGSHNAPGPALPCGVCPRGAPESPRLEATHPGSGKRAAGRNLGSGSDQQRLAAVPPGLCLPIPFPALRPCGAGAPTHLPGTAEPSDSRSPACTLPKEGEGSGMGRGRSGSDIQSVLSPLPPSLPPRRAPPVVPTPKTIAQLGRRLSAPRTHTHKETKGLNLGPTPGSPNAAIRAQATSRGPQTRVRSPRNTAGRTSRGEGS